MHTQTLQRALMRGDIEPFEPVVFMGSAEDGLTSIGGVTITHSTIWVVLDLLVQAGSEVEPGHTAHYIQLSPSLYYLGGA